MIRRLRKKFILTNMALISVVLFSVGIVVCVYNYINLKNDLYDSLKQTLVEQYEEEKPSEDKPSDEKTTEEEMTEEETTDEKITEEKSIEEKTTAEKSSEQNIEKESPTSVPSEKKTVNNRTFTVDFMVSVSREDATITIEENNSEYMEEEIQQMVSAVDLTGTTRGHISKYGMYYYLRKGHSNYELVFANGDYIESCEMEVILLVLAICLVAQLMFFFVSLILSHQAVQPIKEAWKRQKQFVADASHELKTPLTVILTNMNIILKHGGDTVESQQQWITSTKDEGEHMQQLIKDLLILARTEENGGHIEKKMVDFSNLVNKCILQYEVVAYEHGVAFLSNIQDSITIVANVTQLRQLVIILLDNAVKYAGPNGEVKVELCRSHGVWHGVEFSVTNSGEVIPKEKQEHIFDRFYQVEEARTVDRDKGYGLGLSIARNIASNHKADIGVTSTEELGTKFWVHF